jgi:type VI secretion system protein VasD
VRKQGVSPLRDLATVSLGLLYLAVTAAFFTLACSHQTPPPAASPPACKEPSFKVILRGSERLNMDENGRSLPTVFRLYLLKGTHALDGAVFEDLWQRDKDVLGEELIETKELTLNPNDKVSVPLETKPEARYLVVVGLFRNPQGIAWRATRRLTPECTEGRKGPPPPPVLPLSFVAEDYRIEGGL